MFEISPREVTNPTFEGLQATYPYDNGNEIKPTFTLKDDLGNEIPASEYTVNCSNNTDGGEATITISDTEGGNYNISGSKTFEIVTHSHDWNYELDGTDTIKATCSNTDGSCDNTNGGSVSIAAPASLDYTGEAIEAVVTNNLVDKAVTVNVVYTEASGSELTEGKPVKIGTYTASITLGDATAQVTFEIKPAPVVTSIDFNRESPAYDEGSNTFYVSDDFPFELTVTGEYLTMLQNAGGLEAAFYGDTQNAGGTWMGMTIDSDTSANGSYNTSSLFHAINNAGGGSTYIKSIKVGDKWLYVNLKYAPLFTLTINSSENGSVSHDHTLGDDISENVEVTLKVSPNAGYELETLIVDGQDVTTQVSDGKYKFTMPDNDVEVSATFKALPHTHAWEYAASGNVITATCVGTLGVCPNKTSTVTLVAPENLVYNGSEKVVTTSGTIDDVTIPDVQYEGDRVNVGTFTAKLTIDNATATLDVIITPKSISGAVIVLDNNADLVYTGNTITPDVASVTLDGTTLIKDTDYTVSYSDNTNAGQATVTVTGKGNYKDTANTSFTIEKATPVVTAPGAKAGLAYTGQAIELVNEGSTTGGTMQYSLNNITYSADIPTVTNAGTYTVYYKVVGNNNYNDVAASSIEVTINKQTVNKPTIESKEYTGAELTADVLTNELYTVSQDPKTDVGEYDVTLTLTDAANYKWADTENASVTLKFNITAATNSWKTEPSISGWTFGQTASTPIYEAKFGTVKVEYKKAEESAYTTTVPTNAGNYTARFSVAATDNYGALEKTVDFTIAKAQAVITVDATPIEKFYGETLTLPEATSNIGSVTVDKTVAQMKDKGTYTVTYTVAGTNNYDGDTETINVTIKQLPVNIKWENADGLVYDGTQKTITAVLANKVEGDNVNLTVEGVTSATETGTYTANVTAVDNDNYTIINGTNLTKEWAISETANEWTSALSITGWTFGDNANAPTATAKFGTAEFTYADSIDGAYTDTVPTNAGTYYVKATVAGTSSYAEISATAQFVIEAKELNANNITAIEDKTYTGEEIKPVLEVKDGDTTLVLGADYEVTYQNNVNAGTAKAVVTFKGNYKGNAEKEFTILKKQIDPAITLTAPVKNTAPQTEITGTGYTATVVWSPDVNDKFGYNTEYTATITITVDENHTVTGIVANGYTVDGAKTVTNDENSNVVTVAYEKTGSRPSSGGTTHYTVKFDTDDGSNVASKTVARNSTVNEPQAPTKDGYTFEGWYTDAQCTKAYDFDAKVTKNITLYAKWSENKPIASDDCDGTKDDNCPSIAYSDLDTKAWYHLDVDYALEKGFMNGMGEGIFAPDGKLSRAMLVTILWRLEGKPVVDYLMTFEDVDTESWYTEAVRWAASEGIVLGYSAESFAPNDDITREQLATIIYRYEKYKGGGFTGAWMFRMDYADLDDVSEWSYEAMCWCTMNNIVNGKPGKLLDPLGYATRAEAAAMLHRYCEKDK
ncbi:MAG: S-layer homology domain-containing protein, partial [Clostridia bacterium]|nr:S-layer homology domain-containing protein [Clostridia bacterium]